MKIPTPISTSFCSWFFVPNVKGAVGSIFLSHSELLLLVYLLPQGSLLCDCCYCKSWKTWPKSASWLQFIFVSQQQAKARLKKNTRPGGSLTLELMLFALHINNNLYWLSRYCLEVHIWFSPILALEFNICLTLAWIFPFTPSSIFINSSRLLNKKGSLLQVYFSNF